jgi:hypothetical protein
MPPDRPPLRVEARNPISGGNTPISGQSDGLNAVSGHSESRYLHTACAILGSHKQPSIVGQPVPSNSLLTHDKASLSLVTNEEKRGTVTLPQSTELTVELVEIAADARDYVAASRAENTTRVYRTGWAQFTAWCDEHGMRALPAGAETVALYVADLAKVAKPATIDLRLAAISAAHRAAGHDSPTKEEAVRLVRRGVRRTLGTAQRQVHPVTVPELRTMLQGLGVDPGAVGTGRSCCSASRARFAAASWSASTWPTLPRGATNSQFTSGARRPTRRAPGAPSASRTGRTRLPVRSVPGARG